MKFCWFILLSLIFSSPATSEEDNIERIIISTGGSDRHLLMKDVTYSGEAPELPEPFEIKLSVAGENDELNNLQLNLGEKTLIYNISELPNTELVDISFIYFGISELKGIEPGFWNIRLVIPFGKDREECIVDEDGNLLWYDPRPFFRIDFYPEGHAQWYMAKINEACEEKYGASGVLHLVQTLGHK